MNDIQLAILTSVVLNMMKDGGADISALSPLVQEYVLGIWEDYDASEEDEKEQLYWYAHTTLSALAGEEDSKGLLH